MKNMLDKSKLLQNFGSPFPLPWFILREVAKGKKTVDKLYFGIAKLSLHFKATVVVADNLSTSVSVTSL